MKHWFQIGDSFIGRPKKRRAKYFTSSSSSSDNSQESGVEALPTSTPPKKRPRHHSKAERDKRHKAARADSVQVDTCQNGGTQCLSMLILLYLRIRLLQPSRAWTLMIKIRTTSPASPPETIVVAIHQKIHF